MSASPAQSASLLPEPPGFAVRLAQYLPDWRTVSWVDTTGSTNADAQRQLRAAAPGDAGPILLGSHVQTAGRGRAGRPWQTRAGNALLFSCGLLAELPQAALPPLSIAAGVAACEALDRFLPARSAQRLALKWPNDIQWGQAKLAGILAETVALPATAQRPRIGVVLGIGINLRGAAALSTHLGRPVADWSSTGGADDPVAMVAAVAQAWRQALAQFHEHGLAAFAARFAAIDALAGREVHVIDDGRTLMAGIAGGLDDAGRLRVDTAQGMRAVTVGDVSVRARDHEAPQP